VNQSAGKEDDMKRACFAILVASTALAPATLLAQTSTQTAPAQEPTQQASQQGQPITAASISNKTIYDRSNKKFGQISDIVQDQNGRMFVVVTASDNRQVLVPVERVSFNNDRLLFQGSNQDLAAYDEGSGNYKPVEQNTQINLAGMQGEAAGQAGSKIVVQQPAPSVQVQQGAPQVSVQQPQPQVTVRQPNPQILVRQAAPTVTVDLPPPEIIVRMPKPDVNIAMAQPQVEVKQPQPQVQIVQPESKSAVQVQPAQPQVSVQQGGQPQLNLEEQGQPQVTYESAKPRVVINQSQEQPKVRYEQIQGGQAQQQAGASSQQQGTASQEQALATGEQQTAAQQPAGQEQPAQATPKQRTAEQRQAYFKRFGGDVKGQVTEAQSAILVSDLKGMDVWNSQGEQLGEVDEVISINNKPHVVIAHGGFMGIGEDKVAFPLDRFVLSGEDHLVIHGVTENDIEAMDQWQSKVDINENKVADNTQVKLPQLQSK
jgi:sporulation protein YlmC with PRC-barrel domain